MKILLIVYAVSWLILLIYYLYDLTQNGKKKNNNSSNISFEKPKSKTDRTVSGLAWATMFLMAPLVVCASPFIFYSNKKKREKERLEKEERERAVQEERTRDINTFNNLAKTRRNEFDNINIAVSMNFFHMLRTRRYDKILKVLDKSSLPSGMEFGVEEEGTGESKGRSSLYVKTQNGDIKENIFDYINFEDSPEGVWQAYLLKNAWRNLPMGWHGEYDKRKYLVIREDIYSIIPLDKSFNPEVLYDFYIVPQIYIEYSSYAISYYISCCYWTDWGGLIREYVKFKTRKGKILQIIDYDEKVLYKYDCLIDL